MQKNKKTRQSDGYLLKIQLRKITAHSLSA